jgi:KUP system potassium uptake protein
MWNYPLWLCILATGFFATIDLAFFIATLLKIADGGWFPLAIGACVFITMTTWRRGREILFKRLEEGAVPLKGFLASLFKDPPYRVPGTAIFLTATPDAVPHALLHNLSHNKVLHERVVFLTVEVRDVPWISFADRITVESLGRGCWRLRVRYGFMNRPDVTRALELCGALGLEFNLMETSFFLSRQKIVPVHGGPGMAFWRDRVFAAMARNAGNVTDYFNIPTNRVIELGSRVQI